MGSNGVWCAKCAKYLAFGTYGTFAVGVLSNIQTDIINIFFYGKVHKISTEKYKNKEQMIRVWYEYITFIF